MRFFFFVKQAFFLILGLFRHLLAFLHAFFLPRARLAARCMALQSQLAEVKHRIIQKKAPKPHFFSHSFRFLWVVLSRLLPNWQSLAQIMQPDTVVAWHKKAFRLFWRIKSRGRPSIDPKMIALIKRLHRENPLWSPGRIRLTMIQLGMSPPPCEETIKKYMTGPKDHPEKPAGTWNVFLRNHLHCTWAMDFFTVITWNFRILYVFVILDHFRRKVVHFNSTYNPTMEWTKQQLRDALPWDIHPRFMILDNDRIYGNWAAAFLKAVGVQVIKTAIHCPWQNPYVERFFSTLRFELLNHVIILSRKQLHRLLVDYIENYYHVQRPHMGLGGQSPEPYNSPGIPGQPHQLVAKPVCGGLHHVYRFDCQKAA